MSNQDEINRVKELIIFQEGEIDFAEETVSDLHNELVRLQIELEELENE